MGRLKMRLPGSFASSVDRGKEWIRKRPRFVFLAIFAAIVLLTPGFRFIFGKLPFVEMVRDKGQLTAMEQKQLDIHLESIRLIISLSTLLLGGLGFFIAQSQGAPNDVVRRERPLIYASMAFAGAAITLGQVSYEMLAWMLSTKFFNPETPVLMW